MVNASAAAAATRLASCVQNNTTEEVVHAWEAIEHERNRVRTAMVYKLFLLLTLCNISFL